MNVATTVPVTSSTWPAKLLEALLIARLSDIVCKVGTICHRPNSAEVIRLARHGPQSRTPEPKRTPRNANSSGIAVSRTIEIDNSYIRRPPEMSARESSRKPFVQGISAMATRMSRTSPKAPTP